MVSGPLRAMTRARLELIWNAISKGSGALSLISGAVVITIGLACLIPPAYMFSVFGRQLPLAEDVVGSTPAMTWLSTLSALLVFFLGGVAGLRQHRRFDRELLRALPLRTSQILLSELPFGLLDTIPLLALSCFAGLGFGLTRSHPDSILLVLLITALGVVSVLLVQQLVGVLRRLLARPRFLGIAAGLATLPTLALLGLSATQGVKPAAFLVLHWLPTSMAYRGLEAWVHGDKGEAAGFLLLFAGFVAVLFVLTAWLQLKDLAHDPPLRTARAGKENLWTFERPSVGVARLFVRQIVATTYGKVLLVLPFFFTGGFVICAVKVQYVAAGSVMEQLFDKAQTYPLYFLIPPFVVLLGGGFWMNQFAWDRRGVKALFLAPIRSSEILNGKLLGLTWILLPQSLLACLPLAFLDAPPLAHDLVSGVASALFLALALGTFGHVFSARFPRPLTESGAGVARLPFTLQLMSTAVMVALALVSLGVHAGLELVHVWAPPVGFVVLSALTLGLRRGALPLLGRELDAGRETLSETLG
ncbi:MAG: hypothetical protein JKY65_30445 [Planctomycetes bacterium]|nr:hypothetical protein [Planctomycetota bacterium]